MPDDSQSEPRSERRLGTRWDPATLVVVGTAALVFALLASRIREESPPSWDESLIRFVSVHGNGQPIHDALSLLTQAVGEYQGLWFAGLLIVGLLIARRARAALAFGLALCATLATVGLLKPAFHRPALIDNRDDYFPSTHAAGALVVGIAVARLAWSTRWRWPVLLSSLAVVALYGVALVYERSHYPSDVLAGWCIALFWTYGFAVLDADPGRRGGVYRP